MDRAIDGVKGDGRGVEVHRWREMEQRCICGGGFSWSRGGGDRTEYTGVGDGLEVHRWRGMEQRCTGGGEWSRGAQVEGNGAEVHRWRGIERRCRGGGGF